MPTLDHLIFIPGVLLIGFALGFRYGAKAARDEIERRRKARRE